MIKLSINNNQFNFNANRSILQVCNEIGIKIPHFCYHKYLTISGNCRMCLVSVEGYPKLVPSCATMISDGMKVYTDNEKIRLARSEVMELLLINHPLDCPLCDQAGECELQDNSFKYSLNVGKFTETKRSIIDKKYMGPLIETHMNRCIHCSRCIRFSSEIAAVEEIGMLYRGKESEITSYLEKAISSELSGNLIDVCPVGALNAAPYAFKARSWELFRVSSIDISDAQGCNITVDSYNDDIVRILPKENSQINDVWITDKARFSYDGIKNQRLDRPYIRKNGVLTESTWLEAVTLVGQKILEFSGNEIAAIVGDLACVESIFLLKKLFDRLDCRNFRYQFDYKFDTSARGNYLFNTTIEKLALSKLCLIIGADIKNVAPVLNARIGQLQRSNNLSIYRISNSIEQGYNINDLGSEINILEQILEKRHFLAAKLEIARNPIFIIGDGVYLSKDSHYIFSLIHAIVKKYNVVNSEWNGFNVLHNHASSVGFLDIKYKKNNYNKNIEYNDLSKQIKFLYLLGSDEISFKKSEFPFVVYQGHHADKGASVADVIFPAATYLEKRGLYVNFEGRVQSTEPVVSKVGIAKEDWSIINDLSNYLNFNFNIKNFVELRKMLALEYPIFNRIDEIDNNEFKFSEFKKTSFTDKIVIDYNNYYMTNVIARSSDIMKQCLLTANTRS